MGSLILITGTSQRSYHWSTPSACS